MGIDCGKAIDTETASDLNHKAKKEHKESVASNDPMKMASCKIDDLRQIKEKYDTQVSKCKAKIQFYGQSKKKEEALVYIKFLDLVNYEIQLISQRILDFEYIIENPNQSISEDKSSLFMSVILQKFNCIDIDSISVPDLNDAIRNDFESFVKNGNTTEEDLCDKYDTIFKQPEKKKHKEISQKDFQLD